MANQHDPLDPYLCHGLDLTNGDGKEAIGECPFCGKSNKFSVNVDTGKYRCWSCATGTNKGGGNSLVFLERLWEAYDRSTEDYKSLAEKKGLDSATVMQWGACWSYLRNCWMVPGFNERGEVRQLYRYVKVKGGKRRLLSTKGIPHGLFGMNLYDPSRPVIMLCEGVWDAMALWQVLSHTKADRDFENFEETHNPENSLLNLINVLAVPGCTTFKPQWAGVFSGKDLYLLFDNDYPLPNSTTPAVLKGLRRIVNMVGDGPPNIGYLRWGDKEYYDKGLPNGHDVRDALLGAKTAPRRGLADRVAAFARLHGLLVPVPDAWRKRGRTVVSENTGGRIAPCDSYRALVNAWRKALRWTEGLDHGLAVMLASVASTSVMGDQLWIKIIGPAACGKSTLCEALTTNRQYIFSKSTIRGFHSGYKTDSGEDAGLVQQISGKTLVTKDGDTLLQSPNLGQILAEARDLFDGCARTHYRNNLGRNYEGIRMTWILAGTASLRSIDSSELGERFLDCVIMDHIDEDLEKEILWRVVNKTDRVTALEVGEKAEEQYDPDMRRAMELTGGYVQWVRENVARNMQDMEVTDEAKRGIIDLALFVAYVRARPSMHQDESPEREFAARLCSQLMRLAKCLAHVTNRPTLDHQVLSRVRRVAMDTARGKTLDILRHLVEYPEGLGSKTIALNVGQGLPECVRHLRFLQGIGVLRPYRPMKGKVKQNQKWRMTSRMSRIYHAVMDV